MPELFLNGTVGYEITAEKVRDFLASEKSKEITVVINSVGGDVFEGLEIYNILRSCNRRVTTVISGIAVSMGSVIFLAGEERIAMDGTLYMIHKPSTFTFGDATDLRKDADFLDKVQSSIEQIYNDRTEIKDVNSSVDDETWYTVDEMRKNGIINSERKVIFFEEDTIIDSKKEIKINKEIIETEDLLEMALIDDLKAELEEQKQINAKLVEEKEEKALKAELEALKKTNDELKNTQSKVDSNYSTGKKGTEGCQAGKEGEPFKKTENETKKTNNLDKIVEEVIDTSKTVAETTNKNSLPAFMQSTSKY
ncbi:MAG: hypothetical protein [Caudoviricetes sp.]|nr:MAG: hypothetical protein [Caudoviricetes sp.]